MASARFRAQWLLALLLAGLLPLPALAFTVSGLHAGLDPIEQQRADVALAQVQWRLPARLRQALPVDVPMQWVEDLPEHVAGRAFSGQLRLARSLLSSDTPQAQLQLQSTLIHELVHVADRSGGGWSYSARLRELAGWQQRPWRLGRGGNAFTSRQPDTYETHNAAEYLAVNVEHWLLDPQYRCRRPALAAWLTATFGEVPVTSEAAFACGAELPLIAAGAQAGTWELLHLDPERVYAVDYLFAEGAGAPMSRWGHSMLRLVICRPGRPRGPDCRLDLESHRVLSFRAFVGDVQLSNWRGLTGGYPSRLFVLPLQQVVDEYTQVELRGLASYPLALTPVQVSGLLERAAQLHWGYQGRYRFISNNCAVETAKLLVAGVPALDAAGLARFTPKGVRRRLQQAGVLDASVLEDRARAEREGYYFAAADERYAMLFAAAKAELDLPAGDAAGWLRLSAGQRAPWLRRGSLRASAGLLLLEQAAQRRAELRARDVLKRLLLSEPGAAHTQALQALLGEAGEWLQPATMVQGQGYGLPQPGELAALQIAVDGASAQGPQRWQALRDSLRAQLPRGQQRELAGAEANLAVLSAHLRTLAEAQARPHGDTSAD